MDRIASRPQWQAPFPQENVQYGTTHDANFSLGAGASLAKVVLIRPGSVTHHFDQDQRYIELVTTPVDEDTVRFTLPATSNIAPRGFYMAFLVSNQGIPSEARWLELQ